MHRTGHWLGMDVHDVLGNYKVDGQGACSERGMVLTVEAWHISLAGAKGVARNGRVSGFASRDDVLVTGR